MHSSKFALRNRIYGVALGLFWTISLPSSWGAEPTDWKWDGSIESQERSRTRPVIGTRGMVVADDRIAAEWGVEILRRGGNAVDAAVATAFAMAVTRPQHSSLGGGGFFIYCPKPVGKKPQSCHAMDYREKAPGAATRDLYVRDGKARDDLSQNGALASGIPGVPAGLLRMLEKFGSLPRKTLLTRPIELAKKGFPFSGYTERAAQDRWEAMNAEAKKIFGCGKMDLPCSPGVTLKQPDLARVLQAISEKGKDGFYRGWVAQKISKGIQVAGGLITLKDLASYEPRFLDPVTGEFKGHQFVTMPPPSSGGVLLAQLLGYVERADRAKLFSDGAGSAQTLHVLSHALSLAFADRTKHFGDPDFWKVPVKGLQSAAYLDERWSGFDPDEAKLPEAPGIPENFEPKEPTQTTHFSVIDRDGNAVAITTTVNDNFGSAFVPPGTGVVMNNEMDDFSIQPGVPNLFGLIGGEANAVGAGKRPLSSMTPTIVRDSEGNTKLIVGAAGGPRIITSVFLSLVNRLQFNLSLPDAVAAPRFHHQWRPLKLRVERTGFSSEVRASLKKRGYDLEEADRLAVVHALERFPNGRVWGAPDPRGEGAAVAE